MIFHPPIKGMILRLLYLFYNGRAWINGFTHRNYQIYKCFLFIHLLFWRWITLYHHQRHHVVHNSCTIAWRVLSQIVKWKKGCWAWLFILGRRPKSNTYLQLWYFIEFVHNMNITNNRILCKICLDEEIRAVFRPCGHAAVWNYCSKFRV